MSTELFVILYLIWHLLGIVAYYLTLYYIIGKVWIHIFHKISLAMMLLYYIMLGGIAFVLTIITIVQQRKEKWKNMYKEKVERNRKRKNELL